MSKKIFYNSSYFKFFRRHLKPIEIEKEFKNLIHSKNNKEYPKTDRYIYPKEKNINLNFYFQKHSITLINKVRDLFLEFDVDQSDSFDQNEFYQMFNINKIPIKLDEIIYLFKFNNHKKNITFSELINLAFDPDFDQRYKEVIEKIKPRCEIGIICPNDFSGMLSHLCEFGKLSSEAKNFRKKISRTKTRKISNIWNNNSDHKAYIRSKNRDEIIEENERIKNIREIPIKSLNIFGLTTNEEIKNTSNKNLYNRNSSINKTESYTDYELLNKTEKFKKEQNEFINNFKTIIEITKKKIARNEKLFKSINYRNKLDTSKRNLAKSIDILHKINPKINHTYIAYCPIKQKFIDLSTGTGHNFNAVLDIKSKKLKNNRTEQFSNYIPLLTERNKDKAKINDKYNKFFKDHLKNKKDNNKFKMNSNIIKKAGGIYIYDN